MKHIQKYNETSNFNDEEYYTEIEEHQFEESTGIENLVYSNLSLNSIKEYLTHKIPWKNFRPFDNKDIIDIIEFLYYDRPKMREKSWNTPRKSVSDELKETKDKYLLHPAILGFQYETDLCIVSAPDEWFYVVFFDTKQKKYRYFECDQTHGIIQLLSTKYWW
jgi:hypothetical protein